MTHFPIHPAKVCMVAEEEYCWNKDNVWSGGGDTSQLYANVMGAKEQHSPSRGRLDCNLATDKQEHDILSFEQAINTSRTKMREY